MKIVFLLSLIYGITFAGTGKIIVGSYYELNNAKEKERILNDYIKNDAKLSMYFKENSITTNLKKSGEYYIVFIDSLADYSVENFVLKNVKESFYDAFVIAKTPDYVISNTIDSKEKYSIEIISSQQYSKNIDKETSLELSAKIEYENYKSDFTLLIPHELLSDIDSLKIKITDIESKKSYIEPLDGLKDADSKFNYAMKIALSDSTN